MSESLPVTTAGNVYYKLTGYADSDLLVRVEPVDGDLRIGANRDRDEIGR